MGRPGVQTRARHRQGFARGQGTFTLENFDHYNRPIVGLDVDEVTDKIYLVSSNDLEGATAKPLPPGIDTDNGPYWSMTSTIGNMTVPATFVGTDDENCGWTLPQDPAAIPQTWPTRRIRPRSSALANDGGPGAPSGARP